MKQKCVILYVCFNFLIHLAYTNIGVDSSEKKSFKLPPCQSCKLLVGSFKHGMEKTARGKFEGGDAAWEEEKMGSYAKSEVRLVEIQENICSEVEKGQLQCQSLAEENDALLEEWWKHPDSYGDLQDWLCIDQLKACCPELHFGSDCTPCAGYPNNVCNGNGKCKGSGTRKGNGSCKCNTGYDGESCEKCSVGYFISYQDNEKILCSPCYHACQGACTQAGPKGCVACQKGWYRDVEHGCLDINECLIRPSPCKVHQFCVNNDGSFTCIECDKACKTCNGDGPDMCDVCAEGYYLKDRICVSGDEDSSNTKLNMTRYVTYFGLCLATCIVFQKNTYAASFIGLIVALYISISEYMLSSGKANNDINVNIPSLFKNV